MSRTHQEASVRAALTNGPPSPDVLAWGSVEHHPRDMWPAPNHRRKCRCGCDGRVTHIGGCNAVALTGGCELSVRRWVRDGYPEATR